MPNRFRGRRGRQHRLQLRIDAGAMHRDLQRLGAIATDQVAGDAVSALAAGRGVSSPVSDAVGAAAAASAAAS